MRILLATIFAASSGAAHAHVGHLGELAGHDHWVAGAAIGLAIGLSVWGAFKGKKDDAQESEPEAEAEESAA